MLVNIKSVSKNNVEEKEEKEEKDNKVNDEIAKSGSLIDQNRLVLKTIFQNNIDKDDDKSKSKQFDILLNCQSWCPKIMESQFLGMGNVFQDINCGIKDILDIFNIKNSNDSKHKNKRYLISNLRKIESRWNDEVEFNKLHPLLQHIIRTDDIIVISYVESVQFT